MSPACTTLNCAWLLTVQGVWLLSRCGALGVLEYSLHDYYICLGALGILGMAYRALGLVGLFLANRDKQR